MKGNIYAIKSLSSNHIYIGSTIQPLSIRYSKHKYDSQYTHRIKPIHKTIMENGGFDNFYIKTLKEITCDSLEELRVIEKKIIQDYRDNKDFSLMNTRLI
jgi:hypothetical protein